MRRGFCHLEMFGQDYVFYKVISGFFAAFAAFLSALGGKKDFDRRGRREHPERITCSLASVTFVARESSAPTSRAEARGKMRQPSTLSFLWASEWREPDSF